MTRPAWCLVLLAAACAGCSSGEDSTDAPEVTVFAAASLVTALDAIVADFEASHDATVTVSYAASAHLAQQIVAGANADVFLSASVEWTDEIAKSRTILRREHALGNSLVLVAPISNNAGVSGPDDLNSPRVSRVAIGEPGSVPAGNYARNAFSALALWEAIEAKAVYTMDVRQALLYAERGEVDAAVVYASDAVGSDRIAVIAALDHALDAPVRYSFVRLDSQPPNVAAADFFDYLLSSPAGERFTAAGFERLPLEGGAS